MKSIIFKGMLVLTAALTFIGCNSTKKPNYAESSITGWNINDPNYGGYERADYVDDESNIGPNLSFVVGGTFVMGTTQDQVMYEWDNVPRRVTVNSFYMDKTEISNFNYLEYLHWLGWVFSAPNTASIGGGDQSSSATRNWANVYPKALPDTLVWRDPLTYNEPMVTQYLRHPAYRDYPVVGVSWEQATEFCIWRSDRVNEQRMVKAGVLTGIDLNQRGSDNFNVESYLEGLYAPAQEYQTGKLVDMSPNAALNGTEGQPRRVRLEDGIFLPNFRLPTEAEWEFAAVGLIGNTVDENIVERKIYPWNGNYTRLKDGKQMGEFADNFKRGRGDYMGVSGDLNDGAAFTAPIGSYQPNDFGLYNMAGNVSEWVMDVYRPLTFEDMNDIASFRGNVYKTIDEENADKTDEKGRRIYRDVDVEKDNLAARRNYRKSNYINYLDGDFTSQKRTSWTDVPNDNSMEMYHSEGDNPTTLISDKSRVYKGGSWNDRAYFISPGTRRFLDQDRSSATIGFRCAMDRVGTAVIGQTF